MGAINVLPFAVANLIAAGEVVDRPASVIKELMENAIDAGATRITVEIHNGGVTFMRVTDNGCGMSPEDLPVAIRRHATSKIKTAADLDGIFTLGYRFMMEGRPVHVQMKAAMVEENGGKKIILGVTKDDTGPES